MKVVDKLERPLHRLPPSKPRPPKKSSLLLNQTITDDADNDDDDDDDDDEQSPHQEPAVLSSPQWRRLVTNRRLGSN